MSTSVDRFLGRPDGSLMLLGTFHFQPRHLDWYKSQYSLDVLSDEYQVGIADVVERLVAFQPTKIAIERTGISRMRLIGSLALICLTSSRCRPMRSISSVSAGKTPRPRWRVLRERLGPSL